MADKYSIKRVFGAINEAVAAKIRTLLDAVLLDLTAIRAATNTSVTDIGTLFNRQRTAVLNTGALAIKAGGSAVVKTVNTIYAVCNGALVSKAASDMAALSGTVTNAKFNVFVFFIDSAGTLTTAMGTEAATLAAVVWPTFTASKACIGFVIINPTGTGNFVGGTTPLDDAGVTPNAVYVNTPFPFDPKDAVTTAAAAALNTIE